MLSRVVGGGVAVRGGEAVGEGEVVGEGQLGLSGQYILARVGISRCPVGARG